MALNIDTDLNNSSTSHKSKSSEDRDYLELNSLITHMCRGDNTNNSVISTAKIEKTNSMLYNKDIWDVNNHKDDSQDFYNKMEQLKRKGKDLTNKLNSQLEDYNDDVDEQIDTVKIDQINHLVQNDFKGNNLAQKNSTPSYDSQQEMLRNAHVHGNGMISFPSISQANSNCLMNALAQAKYYTPKHIHIHNQQEIMKINIIPRQLNFIPSNFTEQENNKTSSPTQWKSSKKSFIVRNSKFDFPYQPPHQPPHHPTYANGKSASFISNSKTEQADIKDNKLHPNSNPPTPCSNGIITVMTSPKIDLDNIITLKDKRTTLMLRNIPNKYSLTNIIDEISPSFWGKFDYINLPIDHDRKLNLGYAFINFVDPFHIILFYETYRFKKWLKYKSDKKMDMTYADKQGKKDNSSNDIQSYFAEDDKRFNFAAFQPKIEIPIKHQDFLKKLYPNAVCVIEDKNAIYEDKCFVLKSLGKK